MSEFGSWRASCDMFWLCVDRRNASTSLNRYHGSDSRALCVHCVKELAREQPCQALARALVDKVKLELLDLCANSIGARGMQAAEPSAVQLLTLAKYFPKQEPFGVLSSEKKKCHALGQMGVTRFGPVVSHGLRS